MHAPRSEILLLCTVETICGVYIQRYSWIDSTRYTGILYSVVYTRMPYTVLYKVQVL